MTEARDLYRVEVAGLIRDLPLFAVAPGVRIAIVNILGDVELVKSAAKELALKMADRNPEVLVTAEAKSIPLIYELSAVMDLPYVVLRKATSHTWATPRGRNTLDHHRRTAKAVFR